VGWGEVKNITLNWGWGDLRVKKIFREGGVGWGEKIEEYLKKMKILFI